MTLHTLFKTYQHILGLHTHDTLNNNYALTTKTVRLFPDAPTDVVHLLATQACVLTTGPGSPLAIFQAQPVERSNLPHIQYHCSQHSLYRWLTLLSQDLAVRVEHAVLIEWQNIGMLIQGPPGIGKSTLALALLAHGATLVCDDAPYLFNTGQGCIGLCPPRLEGLLHSRQTGLHHITRWQRETQINATLQLQATQHPLPRTQPQQIPGFILPARHPHLIQWIDTLIQTLHRRKE